MKSLPSVSSIASKGYYYILPIIILLWCVLVNRLRSFSVLGLCCDAYNFSHPAPIKAYFRKQPINSKVLLLGLEDLLYGLHNGAKNMVSISVATAIAGIIIGTVSLTGAHQFIGEFVEAISGGSLIVMLILVAVM